MHCFTRWSQYNRKGGDKMKKLLLIAFLLQIVCFNTSAQALGEINNMNGFFNTNDLSNPIDNEKYLTLPNGVFSHTQVMNLPALRLASSLHKILIIVDSTLYSELAFEINRYAYDIHYVYGCSVIMEQVNLETCQDIKNLIISYQSNLDGCVFIGDIVPALYETIDLINGSVLRYWPCDMYYMDLVDGSWPDNDNNGRFDHYAGATPAAHHLHEWMRSYLYKTHKFWVGHRKVNKKKALAYTNSPWHSRPYFSNDISALFDNNNTISYTPNNHTLGKIDFLNLINDDTYEFVQIELGIPI